jgi:hypothetical protein
MELGGSQHGNLHRSWTTLMLENYERHAKKFSYGKTSKCQTESSPFLGASSAGNP